MRLFAQIKDMTTMVKAAPDLIDQANHLAAQAGAHQHQMYAQAVSSRPARSVGSC